MMDELLQTKQSIYITVYKEWFKWTIVGFFNIFIVKLDFRLHLTYPCIVYYTQKKIGPWPERDHFITNPNP